MIGTPFPVGAGPRRFFDTTVSCFGIKTLISEFPFLRKRQNLTQNQIGEYPMPNTYVRAAAEGMPIAEVMNDVSVSRPVHPLGLKTKTLPFSQLGALVDTLQTVHDVLSGLQEQPRFSADGTEPYNEAGVILECLRNNIGCEIDDIRDEVAQRRVSSEDEGENKFGILIGRYTGGCDAPSAAVSDLAQIAAEIAADLRKVGAA
ncbi:hypothetical protein [Mesorhizobium abyssinicae]|uniref:hypothetical protein n=1 Tax=Mesorhizobium abyssinicae TaxID=1209958 RepID=UPI0033949731